MLLDCTFLRHLKPSKNDLRLRVCSVISRKSIRNTILTHDVPSILEIFKIRNQQAKYKTALSKERGMNEPNNP